MSGFGQAETVDELAAADYFETPEETEEEWVARMEKAGVDFGKSDDEIERKITEIEAGEQK